MELKVGQFVRYAYHVGAMSACQNGKVVEGEGRIDEIRPAGREPYIGVGRVWLFPREIKAHSPPPRSPNMPIGSSDAGRGKLTEAQRSLLTRSVMASEAGTVLRPQDVSVAGELSAMDLVKHHRAEADGIWRIQATPAGRAALSAVEAPDA